MSELITCEMVTGKDPKRYELSEMSIKSFKEQTYEPKQLWIINDGERELKPTEDNIREFYLTDKDRNLGQLRNYFLDRLDEEYDKWIRVPWCDDDWHHPELLERQYNKLNNDNVNAVFLRKEVQYSFQHDIGWVQDSNSRIPDTLMERENDARYPEIKKGEDTKYIHNINNTRNWNNPPHLFLRFIHGENTWGIDHFNIPNSTNLPDESEKYLNKIVKRYKENVSWL